MGLTVSHNTAKKISHKPLGSLWLFSSNGYRVQRKFMRIETENKKKRSCLASVFESFETYKPRVTF